ncbi:hypothetical protein [Shewanella sp. NIFS-20-20]|uniref:hypothetical protein n=1 Tax=Shewanella sp. NIFS-20-20 TaxID=2853806 RepID=UPI001C495661|nr:hypothetical protein [Shewanella sp. NIFS-20-20]MBV7316570.1 hypothetical protein [Shewanella sp. NIFS-20-20]
MKLYGIWLLGLSCAPLAVMAQSVADFGDAPLSASHNECPFAPWSAESSFDSQHLSASYVVTDAQGSRFTMQLHRNQQQLLIERSATTFEGWHHGEYVRYFPSERRSVTYQRGDLLALGQHVDLKQLYHVVSPSVLSQLSLSAQHQGNSPCVASATYRGEYQGQQLMVDWLEPWALPREMVMTNAEHAVVHLQLQALTPLSEQDFVHMTQGYEDIDFADVGDNEADPFIATMIHQGYIQHGRSGFYHSFERGQADAVRDEHQH